MRVNSLKTCTFCHKQIYRVAGHGLCAACYYREKRNGTPDYVKVRKPCSIEGCEHLSAAHGLCALHYSRLRKHGTAEGERFDKWGHRHGHPLYERWRHMRRQRHPIAAEWEDFWRFARDVGDPPSLRHKIRRAVASLPYGPKNFAWVEPITDVSSRHAKAEYMRVYRLANERGFRSTKLRQLYGINIDEYERMLAEQGHVCAICGLIEPIKDRRTGGSFSLGVDHCHKTGAVRGLLCSGCNNGLGALKDDPEILRRAIAYLERHRSKESA